MTVRQRGWSRSRKSPWRSKKRAKVAAGIRVNVVGSADQIDDPSGTRYQSRKPAGPAVRSEHVLEGHAVGRRVLEEPPGKPVEPADVGEHPPERRSGHVAPLGEHRRRRGASPFEPGALIGDAEAHVAGLGRHAETVEEPAEQRIGALVVDEEPGVDVRRGVGELHPVRVGVAPGRSSAS